MKTSYIFWPVFFCSLCDILHHSLNYDIERRKLEQKPVPEKSGLGLDMFMVPGTPPMPRLIPETPEEKAPRNPTI